MKARTFAFGDGTSYGILQEAYVKYTNGGHTFLAGNYELSTHMLDADDWYLLANTFQGVYYKNTTIKNITVCGWICLSNGRSMGWWSKKTSPISTLLRINLMLQRKIKRNAGDAGMWAGMYSNT